MGARGEFKTAAEAEHMLSELHRAARYCTGPKSARQHGIRIREVEEEVKRLRRAEEAPRMESVVPIEQGGIDVNDWSPTPDAKPVEVHIVLSVREDLPRFAIRLKSRDACERLAAVIRDHGATVWPAADADAIDDVVREALALLQATEGRGLAVGELTPARAFAMAAQGGVGYGALLGGSKMDDEDAAKLAVGFLEMMLQARPLADAELEAERKARS